MEKRKQSVKTKSGNVNDKKQRRAAKDPNQPKRPPSAFFVFMEEFRKSFKILHPEEKSVAVVGKAGGNKWKEMSVEDKAPYVKEATNRKATYTKDMAAYKKESGGELTEGYADSDADGSGDE